MKIAALRYFNVKRFARKGIAIENIGDGVNVLCAPNEYGKSTSFEALHALFFQPHTGAGRDVRRLQPYSGGQPLVEADIIVPEGRFRLTKQFLGGKRATVQEIATGRLLAQADEAENFISSLIRGGAAGPAGLLWVRQGVTGIGDRDKREEEGERQVRESLLTSVQGEVEAITGGRRMSQIMAACREELGRLVTPTGRPKAGGPYHTALLGRDHLAQEEQRLAGEVASLRAALDQRATAQKLLDELTDAQEKAERRASVLRAQAACEQARSHAEKLTAAQAQAELARTRLETEERELARLHEATQRSEQLQLEIVKAQLKRDEAQTLRNRAGEDIDRALAEVQAAEAQETEIRDLLARLDAALKARQEARELEALRERLARAEALRILIEESQAALALISVPADRIEALEQLEIEIVRRRAAEDASLPTVRIAYEHATSSPLLMNGQPLPPDEDRPLRENARIVIPAIGTLTLRTNRPPVSDGKLQAAEMKHRETLAALGVVSLAQARQRQNEAREKAATLKTIQLEFGHLVPEGLSVLRAEIARRAAQVMPELELKAAPEEVRQALEEATRRVGLARSNAREVQPQHRHASDAMVAAEAACATLEAERARLDTLLGPEEARDARLRERVAAISALKEAFRQLEAHAGALRSGAPDLAAMEGALNRARSVEESSLKEENRLTVLLADLNGHIRAHAHDAVEEAWRETAEALEAANRRVAAFEAETAALNRLDEALQTSRRAARDLYLQPVINELRPLLGLLFDDVAITFDEKTLLPQTLRRNGLDEEIDRLSGGMREQLSVLTRLAFARLLAQDGRPAPVILDDALVYSDDDRIERMFDALHRQAREQQIIVFSCRQRAFAKLGGTALTMQEWHPKET